MQVGTIDCERHGTSGRAVVCQHLLQPGSDGYFVVLAEGSEPTQAWCEVCEHARIADQGWYDDADNVAQWSLVCEECLEHAVRDRRLIQQFGGQVPPDEKPA